MPSTDMQEARGLRDAQLEAIAALERRVVAHDGGRLKLEWSVLRERDPAEVNDLLAWDGEMLAGFCGLYSFGSEPELSGAVDPQYRRRGVGTALLARATELIRERGHPTVLLVTPRTTDAGRRFAEARGATFHHAEHHMDLAGDPVGPPAPQAATAGLVVRPAVHADHDAIVSILADAFGHGGESAGASGPQDVAFVATRESTVVGALRLSFETGSAGVYGFAVHSTLRGKGIGRAVLYEVCLEARRRGAGTVTLEVEVDNDHALGLYTSVGFERRTTEDYFRLTL
ncbi:MAG: GNAT family N-acetyltransferase [Acidimicrobiales bacterium]